MSVLTSAKYDQIKICDKEKFHEFPEIVTSNSHSYSFRHWWEQWRHFEVLPEVEDWPRVSVLASGLWEWLLLKYTTHKVSWVSFFSINSLI